MQQKMKDVSHRWLHIVCATDGKICCIEMRIMNPVDVHCCPKIGDSPAEKTIWI